MGQGIGERGVPAWASAFVDVAMTIGCGGDRNEVAGPRERLDDSELLLRLDTREDPRVACQSIERRLTVFPLEPHVGACHHLRRCEPQTGTCCDRGRGPRVIAGDHRYLDAGCAAGRNGGGNLGTNWILHPCQSEEGQVDQVIMIEAALRLDAQPSPPNTPALFQRYC